MSSGEAVLVVAGAVTGVVVVLVFSGEEVLVVAGDVVGVVVLVAGGVWGCPQAPPQQQDHHHCYQKMTGRAHQRCPSTDALSEICHRSYLSPTNASAAVDMLERGSDTPLPPSRVPGTVPDAGNLGPHWPAEPRCLVIALRSLGSGVEAGFGLGRVVNTCWRSACRRSVCGGGCLGWWLVVGGWWLVVGG